ncbi:MAG TPA: hypothetical protein DEO70_07430 [Bacteroidales bacterium]|nr:MAG: hypothetical protein A2X11_07050 [Bacteroidetes bacterium GWE2_42_24]OFY25939.1 MAG: hypothetical protein A2X09_04545 [Bacteroidetes bacterium GWF2_43_11]PKP21406.1 MAG: hypothetical protein CVU06_10055 [Bacteroidetes bacterium HGW-Bacteroidetes-22]HBZ66653.1 hypothetical protein [Bacteroidales bacterium]
MGYANRVYIVIVFICTVLGVKAQQEPQFTQYMFAPMAYNPAFAGTSGNISVTGLLREQWVGFTDATGTRVSPRTFFLSVDAPLRILHGGVGLTILSDKLGYEQNIGLKLSYAYITDFRSGEISFGPTLGLMNRSIDFASLNPLESGSDPLLNGTDADKPMMFDVGLGVLYRVPGKYYMGFAASQLIQSTGSLGDEPNYQNKRHLYLQGGYEYVIPDYPLYEVEPSVLIKTDMVSYQVDLTGRVTYNQKFWGAVSYRITDAIAILLGIKIKQLSVGYSYDITTSKLGSAGSSGSHEIVVNYSFKLDLDKNPKSYRNTRFL